MFVVFCANHLFKRFFELIIRNLVGLFVLPEFGHDDEKANFLEHRILLDLFHEVDKFLLLHEFLDKVLSILKRSVCKI